MNIENNDGFGIPIPDNLEVKAYKFPAEMIVRKILGEEIGSELEDLYDELIENSAVFNDLVSHELNVLAEHRITTVADWQQFNEVEQAKFFARLIVKAQAKKAAEEESTKLADSAREL